MPYCLNCGREVIAGMKYCSNCGAALAPAGGATPIASDRPSRPVGLPPGARALALIGAVVGVGIIALGIFIIAIGILRYVLAQTIFALVFGGFVILLGSLALVVSYGLHTRQRWVRLLGTWSGVVYVVFGVLFLTAGDVVVAIASILLGVATAYYLNTKAAKEYLRGTPG